MATDINFEAKMREACQKIETVGKSYAEARAQSWLLQEQRKVVLSNEMRGLQGSMAEREMLARCSAVYQAHLVGTSQAIRQELSLRAELDKWQAVFEALRSLGSLEKAKMNMI